MAKGLITQATLTGIADAIRAKAGTSDAMRPDEMAALIQSISGGGKVAFGSVELSSSSSTSIDITHNLGVVPNLIAVFTGSGISTTDRLVSLYVIPEATYITETYYYSSTGTISSTSLGNNESNLAKAFPTLTETDMTVKSNGIQSSIYFYRGKYIWIAAEVSA